MDHSTEPTSIWYNPEGHVPQCLDTYKKKGIDSLESLIHESDLSINS